MGLISAVTLPRADLKKTSQVGFRFLLFPAVTRLPSFFFYQQQWVHFTAHKMIKAMQIGLKLCRRWRAKRDRSLLPLELKDLISNLYVPPEAGESSHPSFVGWRELMIARGPRAVRLVNFMTAMSELLPRKIARLNPTEMPPTLKDT